MTKPWRDMTDRERDALIAEKVIGAEREEVNYTIGHSSYTSVFWHIGGWRFDEASLPHYSTEIGAAWRVVERLHAQRVRVAVIAYLDGNYRCELRGQGTEFLLAMEGPTAPAAICLAALKVVGTEV